MAPLADDGGDASQEDAEEAGAADALDTAPSWPRVEDRFEETARAQLEGVSTSPRKDTVLLRSCVRAEFFGEALATVLRVCTLALAGGSKLVAGGVWGACRSGKERTGSDGSTRAGDWLAQAVAVTKTGEGSAGAAPGRPDTGPPSTSPRRPDKPPLCWAEPWRLLAKLVTFNGVV